MELAPYKFEHGERFGKLTFLRLAKKTSDRPAKAVVGCECGTVIQVRASKLRKGRVTECLKCGNRDAKRGD